MSGPLNLKFANHFIIYQKRPLRGRFGTSRLHSELWDWGVKDHFFNHYKHHQLLRLAEKESKAHPWNIRASRSYYEVKLNGEAEVIQISKRIDKLKSEIVVLKSSYRQAMVNLDAISTQVGFLI